MKIRTIMMTLLLGLALNVPRVAGAQQVTCTPNVAPAICKQFDLSFGSASMWPRFYSARRVYIVVVDPVQFKAERAKVAAEMEAAAKNRNTVADINRAGGREAGRGVFKYEILECPHSLGVERIVISTEASDSESPISELSEQLLFYVIGYDQGLLQGVGNMTP